MRPFRVVKHSIHTKSWYIDVLEGRALTLVCTALSNQDQLLQHIAHKVDTGPHFITLSAIIRNSATLSRRDAWANLQNVHVVHADTILRCGVVYPELEVGSLYTYGEGQGCLAKIRSGRGGSASLCCRFGHAASGYARLAWSLKYRLACRIWLSFNNHGRKADEI